MNNNNLKEQQQQNVLEQQQINNIQTQKILILDLRFSNELEKKDL